MRINFIGDSYFEKELSLENYEELSDYAVTSNFKGVSRIMGKDHGEVIINWDNVTFIEQE